LIKNCKNGRLIQLAVVRNIPHPPLASSSKEGLLSLYT
jgi:hypothetical protein